MLTTWFATEASWRHNRLHLVLVSIALVLLIANPQIPSAIFATMIVGTLLIRVYLWDLRRAHS